MNHPTDDGDPEEPLDERRKNSERHAFLLRLGVWEVLPIEAWQNAELGNRERFPWTGASNHKQLSESAGPEGWTFGLNGWGGGHHENVYLEEDYRFLWSLSEAAQRDPRALSTLLAIGHRLYTERLTSLVFCPNCSVDGGSHRSRRRSERDDGYPSTLAIQLRNDAWVTCTRDGNEMPNPVSPIDAWWHEKPPVGAGLTQSPWRLVPLCSPPVVSDELRRMCRVNTMSGTSADTVVALLRQLKTDLEAGSLAADPTSSGTARQAFVSIHRLAYERLDELANDHDEIASWLADTGILCEYGSALVHSPIDEARHDDGRYSAYVRHFASRVPFLVLPRDDESRAHARRLGVKPFEVKPPGAEATMAKRSPMS